MDFELNAQQQLFQKTAQAFAESVVTPYVEEIERSSAIPEELLGKLRQFGAFGLPYDKKYGGAGGTYFESMLMIEALSKVCSGLGFFMAVHYLGASAINLFGKEEQKQRFLPQLAAGKMIGSFGFTEPNTGVDPRALTCTATPTENGYLLNGQKRFVTLAGSPGYLVTWANTPEGVTAFIVEKFCEGYNLSNPWRKMGNHGADTFDVRFENVFVPEENVLGPLGKGMTSLTIGIALGKLNMCAISLGLGDAAINEAVSYAMQRIVYGKPMAKMATTQALIADAVARVEASRWMTYRATTRAAGRIGDVAYDSALAKLFVSEAVQKAIDNCLQVHGCYGVIEDFKIERIYRDIRIMAVVEGSNEVMRAMVAGNALKK